MTRNADRIIADLLNAIDAIRRASGDPYVQGIAEQATKMAHDRMVRNSDGYLVARE